MNLVKVVHAPDKSIYSVSWPVIAAVAASGYVAIRLVKQSLKKA